jgi:hypothetical protein
MTHEGHQLISLADVARSFRKENGRNTRLETVHRWWKKGVRGRKLQVIQVGGRYYTTASWLQDFGVIHNPPSAELETGNSLREARPNSRSVAQARKFLASKGVRCGNEARGMSLVPRTAGRD